MLELLLSSLQKVFERLPTAGERDGVLPASLLDKLEDLLLLSVRLVDSLLTGVGLVPLPGASPEPCPASLIGDFAPRRPIVALVLVTLPFLTSICRCGSPLSTFGVLGVREPLSVRYCWDDLLSCGCRQVLLRLGVLVRSSDR